MVPETDFSVIFRNAVAGAPDKTMPFYEAGGQKVSLQDLVSEVEGKTKTGRQLREALEMVADDNNAPIAQAVRHFVMHKEFGIPGKPDLKKVAEHKAAVTAQAQKKTA